MGRGGRCKAPVPFSALPFPALPLPPSSCCSQGAASKPPLRKLPRDANLEITWAICVFYFSPWEKKNKKMVLLSVEWKAVVPSRTFLQLLRSARVPRAKPQGQGSPWHPGCCRKLEAQEQGKVPGCSLHPEGLFVLRRSSNRSPCALVTPCCKSPLCLLLELFNIPF